ncbi:calcium-translocating P-type ATPase, PMCA-type [Tannerella forsythia]|uniref:P-type Ca(2+) transporter n=1 Tax=Tannerella forsythia TaxID=28112 RepID=A0A3P1YTY3_TANFO|nr:calcium-translocating P-type ATPase, PMCA-type [Tannerella forsythia]RRD74544.1 calcium-translocating P-type ATPase, PMCA-type [Tannerella forsythia]
MERKHHFTGLTNEKVLESREKHGTNVLTPPEKEPLWRLFAEKFEDPIIRILLIAAFLSLGISFVHWEFAETIGIFCAIFLATGVAFWFELDANKKFDVLNQVNDDALVKVIRNELVCEVPKKDIVVGDIVILGTGEEVPADGELLEAVSLQVDESCLTGEPMIDKTTNPSDFQSEATYPSNWAMRGTKVMDGHGILEIKRVGDSTEYGKVAEQSTEMKREETPLNQQLDKLAKFIGVVGFILAILTFFALFIKDIFLGTTTFTMAQLGSIGIIFVSAMVVLVKVWVPIIYDAFELCGKTKEVPQCIDGRSWLQWIGLGGGVFIVLSVMGFAFGINPLHTESWISLDVAGRILQYFMVAVTLIVVAVPEGLPMSVTLSLALSMRRMLQNNNLVRKMHACETMGATTVICTDKTGTLTQNQMQVYETQFFALDNQLLSNSELSNLIKESISVNSTAYLDSSQPQKIKSIGNPTEAALLLWLYNQQVDYLGIRESAEIIDQLTFSTERKYMATLINSPLLNRKVLYVKGAPEIVLSKSDNVLFKSGKKSVSDSEKEIEELLLQYQNQAMRILGFAYEIIEDDMPRFENGNLVNVNLTYLGLTAISDPVREDVPLAVNECLNAGIQVKIVTGDTPGTAREIGRQIGIWNESDKLHNIITGTEFERLSDEEALKRVEHLKIMCRARPTDKQRLVQLLQRSGEIVAVTGDGTNDAPALNYAQVGLSMGSGTSVAKEASDITLLDDSFKSIASAVMWGRSLYQNIQRFILFQLTINVAALVIVLLGSIFGYELPLTVTQMLWVNLIMDTFAAGALASLPPNEKVMDNKPRKNDAFIITPAMRFNILFVGFSFVALLLGLLFIFTENGVVSPYDLSRFFTIFVMLQFWNMFNAKAFLTRKSAFSNIKNCIGFILVAIVILVGQVLIVEFGGKVFRTVPLSLKDWGIIIGATSFVLWIGEIVRFTKK